MQTFEQSILDAISNLNNRVRSLEAAEIPIDVFRATTFIIGAPVAARGGYTSTIPIVDLELVSGNAVYALRAYADSTTTFGIIMLGHSRGTTLGTPATSNNSDILGAIVFEGVNAAATPAWATAAYIRAKQYGAAGATYVGADLEIYTATNAVANALAMTIYNGGGVFVGVTATAPGVNNFGVQGVYKVGSNQVVGARGAHVADADGSLASVTAQFNTLLTRLETHGLLATA